MFNCDGRHSYVGNFIGIFNKEVDMITLEEVVLIAIEMGSDLSIAEAKKVVRIYNERKDDCELKEIIDECNAKEFRP